MSWSSIFFAIFITVATVMSARASFSRKEVGRLDVADMNAIQRDVYFDRARLGKRILLFFFYLFSSPINPAVYIVSIIIAVLIYIAMLVMQLFL